MTTEDIDKTIDKLCEGLKPVKPCCPTRNGLLWILLVICYTSAVAIAIGFRPNIDEAMARDDFIFEMILAFSIAISASLVTFWISIPGCEKRTRYMPVPLTLLAVQFVWMIERLYFEGLGHIRENWLSHCWMNTALHTTLPAIAVIMLVKRSGATVMPGWMAAFALIAVSEFGWIGMRLICPKDNVGEAYLINFLPYVVIGVAIGFIGKKLFRW